MNTTMTLTRKANVNARNVTMMSFKHLRLLVLAGALLMVAAWTRPVSALTWSVENVDAALQSGHADAIALDASDRPHIVYSDWFNGSLKYARKLATGSWSIETVESGLDTGFGYVASLALDSSGQPHVSYNGPLATVKYAHRSCFIVRWPVARKMCAWRIETVGEGEGTSIALDSSGRPHISYLHVYSPTVQEIKYATKGSSGWQTETVATFSSLGSTGYHTAIALDAGGLPHISYRQATGCLCNDAYIKYARKSTTGGAWTSETVDLASNGGAAPSLVLDSGDRPHLSYRGADAANHALKYARKLATGSWSIETVDSSSEIRFPSLALDSSDRPHISYIYRGSSTSTWYRVLKYTKKVCFTIQLTTGTFTACTWTSETIDSDDVALSVTWLALDSSDRPHIAYYDFTHDAPKYAHGF